MRERGISSTSPFQGSGGDSIVSSPTRIERYGLGLLETDMDTDSSQHRIQVLARETLNLCAESAESFIVTAISGLSVAFLRE